MVVHVERLMPEKIGSVNVERENGQLAGIDRLPSLRHEVLALQALTQCRVGRRPGTQPGSTAHGCNVVVVGVTEG